MDVRIINLFSQQFGNKTHYWGRSDDKILYYLNNYPDIHKIVKILPRFSQDKHNPFLSLKIPRHTNLNFPRPNLTKISCTKINIF